jgi:hypothetical protein
MSSFGTRHVIDWKPKLPRQQASCPADPRHPAGVDLDVSRGYANCLVKIPYPAECVGTWKISCLKCGQQAIVTAAGRTDDPRSIKLACMQTPLHGVTTELVEE